MMMRIFQMLLRLYPRGPRELLDEEMAWVFGEAAAEHRSRGRWAYARFAAVEIAGLLLGCVRAWMREREADQDIDLRLMRPPEMSKKKYVTALDELIAARQVVTANLARMQDAIARHEFVKARHFSDEERKARAHLRLLHRKYRIVE